MQNLLVNKLLYRTHFTSISSIHRLFFSTSLPSDETVIENPPLKSPFAMEYLVKSCGVPMEKAINVYKCISSLRCPVKPDSVLLFLRESGLSDADIRKTVTYDPRILCASLERTIKPRVMEIREIGFSPVQLAQLVSLTPIIFVTKHSSLQKNVHFWMPFLGSLEGILRALKRAPFLLATNVDKVVRPNILFLEKHCLVAPSQIRSMITRVPGLFTINTNKLEEAAQRAEELGFPKSSGLFIYALQITLSWRPSQLDSKIKNLRNLGFSKEEIGSMIKTHPMLFTKSDERNQKIIAFLTSEAGLDLSYIASHPKLLSYSLERRIIPRHCVLKSLESKGLSGNWSFSYVMNLTEKLFRGRIVSPHKDLIPEAIEAYEASLAVKTSIEGEV